MIKSKEFILAAKEAKVDFWVGVPCSFLTPLINGVMKDTTMPYITATSEGEGLAIASGAWLAGRTPVMMCQNSGLGNLTNPLVSLNATFNIPVLLITTWRGQPGISDEPQHELMGKITHSLLSTCEVEVVDFPSNSSTLRSEISRATQYLSSSRRPYAFVMKKGDVESEVYEGESIEILKSKGSINLVKGNQRHLRHEVLEKLLEYLPKETPIIATTGKTGRELFTLQDSDNHFYMVGSMGCCSALGLGVALNFDKKVVVLDGDGALLMKMSNLATIGANSPHNLIHILLDNGVHDSTGGQHTVSNCVNFSLVASACGYSQTYELNRLEDLEQVLHQCNKTTGPHFIHIRIRPGSLKNLGRPSIAPKDVAIRFKRFLTNDLNT